MGTRDQFEGLPEASEGVQTKATLERATSLAVDGCTLLAIFFRGKVACCLLYYRIGNICPSMVRHAFGVKGKKVEPYVSLRRLRKSLDALRSILACSFYFLMKRCSLSQSTMNNSNWGLSFDHLTTQCSIFHSKTLQCKSCVTV